MELRQYFLVVWRRWWLILLTTIVAAGVAYGLGSRQVPIYQSTAVLEVDRGTSPSDDPYSVQRNSEIEAETYARQISADPVLVEVIALLEINWNPDTVEELLTIAQMPNTSMIQIGAVHTDPALAQALAQTTAEVFIRQKQAQQQARYQASLDELDALVSEMEQRIMDTRVQIVAMGDLEGLSPLASAELARLQTQLNNNQIRHNVLLQSAESFRLAMARSGNYISIFSWAELPQSPVGPLVMRNTALAAVVGGMIGVGIAFLLEYLDDTLHNPEEAQAALGMATLASIPELKDMEPRALITRKQPLHPVSEAFRNLRTSVQFANLDSSIRTLLITSPTPAEGKSFVAANLAVALAQGGKKVLLLDTDLRHPVAHRIMSTEKTPGLSDLLYAISEEGDKADRFAGVQVFHPAGEDLPTLSVLPAGKRVPNPAEVLGSQLFHDLLSWLRDRFDVVVIDSPPLLAVTDAAVVATQVDGVAMVLTAGETHQGAAIQALERLNSVGAKVLGLIMNRMSTERGGYYYYYYHHYPYGDGNGSSSSGRKRLRDRFVPSFARKKVVEPLSVEEPNA